MLRSPSPAGEQKTPTSVAAGRGHQPRDHGGGLGRTPSPSNSAVIIARSGPRSRWAAGQGPSRRRSSTKTTGGCHRPGAARPDPREETPHALRSPSRARRVARRARGSAPAASTVQRCPACPRTGAAHIRNSQTPWAHCTLRALRDTLRAMRALMLGLLIASAWLAVPRSTAAFSIQEAILRVKPGVVLITAEVRADVTLNCGRGPVTVSPAPFIETGSGWFVDGRGFIVTNAHVVDPAHRLPPWVSHELKKKAIDEACVVPQLRARGLMRGERPDLEDEIRREATGRALATAN